MKKFARFTEDDREFIRKNILAMTNKEIGGHLGRSESSIAWQVGQMGIGRNVKKWTKEEIERVRSMASSKTLREIAEIMGVTRSSIKALMKTNDIKTGRNGRFKKGNIPPYKGKKLPRHFITKKMKSTQFKSGQLPHNTLKDGDITIRSMKGGVLRYKWIRLSLKKWEMLHRYNYKKYKGPIPDDMMVSFKDNNTLNCDPDNLYLENKQEHMARNTIARFPPELQSTIRLVAKVKRKIKSHEKQD